MNLDRRSFVRGCALGPAVLAFDARGFWSPRADDRCLCVLELGGGNDGLNTVIPVDDARYAALRPRLSVVRRGAHRLGDGTALHPSLARLQAHIAAGRGAVVHGVGYDPPDRSHFRSRDIWHVADPRHQQVNAATTGWLGRAAAHLAGASSGLPAVAVGALEVPLLLHSRSVAVPSLSRLEDFQWLAAAAPAPLGAAAPMRRLLDGARGDELLDRVLATQRRGVELADGLAAALQRYRSRAEYPATDLGRSLQLIARLFVAGFGTRLVHTSLSGFDTHARQLPAHAGLLGQLDAALAAFLDDLSAHGCVDRVAVLVHSEFGRRAQENASQGTDHGAAAPVFVFGGEVAGGVHGTPPDLQRLVDGDVAVGQDFRGVYADLLAWLGIDARSVLGDGFARPGLWPA